METYNGVLHSLNEEQILFMKEVWGDRKINKWEVYIEEELKKYQ